MTNLNTQPMPVLFIGHGSPMNILDTNKFTKALGGVRKSIPTPKAILCISAHWQTKGTYVTSTDTPKIIYDFYGFPEELYKATYPAKGSQFAALKIHNLLEDTKVQFDNGAWGLDHGSWSILKHLYPEADIPVLQLSIDTNLTPDSHFKLGQQLKKLRNEGILIIGSGNIVHNLRNFSWNETETPFDWAIEFDRWVKQQLDSRNFHALISDYAKSTAGSLSIPTLEHYLPLLYTLGASHESDPLNYIYEEIHNGSIAMRSFMIG